MMSGQRNQWEMKEEYSSLCLSPAHLIDRHTPLSQETQKPCKQQTQRVMLPSATRTDVVGGKEKKGWMENKMPQEVISSLPLGPRIAAKTWIPESRYSQSPEEEPQKPKPRAGGSPRDRVILRCRDGPLGRFVHKGRRVKGTLYTRTEVCWLPHGFFFFF